MRRILVLGLCTAVAACQPQKGSSSKSEPAVARGSGFTITADEFKARIDEQSPFLRARYSSLDRKKELLDNLIRFEVLAREAARQGLDKDPDVQNTLKKIMVQKLVQKNFQQEPGGATDIPEAELQRYYAEHDAEYNRPRRVRLAAVVFDAPAGTPQRAKKLAIAKKALTKVRAEEKRNALAFAQIVSEFSEDAAAKATAGDLQFKSYDELAKAHSKQLADAAFALKTGEISGVVETPAALYILKLTGEQPELSRSFEQVKAQIANKLHRERKTKEFDEWLKGLREKANITIDEKALEAVQVAAAPAAPPGTMGPLAPMGAPPTAAHPTPPATK